MRTLRKITAAVLLAFAITVPAGAQTVASNPHDTYPLASWYDLDSAAFVYCVTTGINDEVLGQWRRHSPAMGIVTDAVAASTTVTGTNIYNGVVAGDELLFVNRGGAGSATLPSQFRRVLITKTNVSSGVIQAAVTLNANSTMVWRRRTCATSGGWVPISGFNTTTFQIGAEQANTTTGIVWQVECRQNSAENEPVIVSGPTTEAAVFSKAYSVALADTYDECRLGIKLASTDDGGDTGVDAERVNISVSVRR
jgi:hypothetical protein